MFTISSVAQPMNSSYALHLFDSDSSHLDFFLSIPTSSVHGVGLEFVLFQGVILQELLLLDIRLELEIVEWHIPLVRRVLMQDQELGQLRLPRMRHHSIADQFFVH